MKCVASDIKTKIYTMKILIVLLLLAGQIYSLSIFDNKYTANINGICTDIAEYQCINCDGAGHEIACNQFGGCSHYIYWDENCISLNYYTNVYWNKDCEDYGECNFFVTNNSALIITICILVILTFGFCCMTFLRLINFIRNKNKDDIKLTMTP